MTCRQQIEFWFRRNEVNLNTIQSNILYTQRKIGKKAEYSERPSGRNYEQLRREWIASAWCRTASTRTEVLENATRRNHCPALAPSDGRCMKSSCLRDNWICPKRLKSERDTVQFAVRTGWENRMDWCDDKFLEMIDSRKKCNTCLRRCTISVTTVQR